MRFTVIFVLLWLVPGCASKSVPAETSTPPAVSSECTFCPTVSPRGCTLCVETNPLLNVDKDGVTSGTVRLCNRGATPSTLALDLSDFYARDPHGTLYPLSSVRSLAADSPAHKPIVDGQSPLAPNSCVDVKIDASRIWQAGLAKADLRNGTDTVIPLHAVRYQVPFNLKVDGPTPESVNLVFTRGQQGTIKLRNEDGMSYPFAWRLELGDTVHSGTGFVSANGQTTIPVSLDSSNFSFFESGFLRSGDRAGMLSLSFQPDTSFGVLPLPQKRYPVNARLSFFGSTLQKIMNYALVLLVLLAGIFVSLLINHALPLQKKRVEMKLRLANLEGRLAGLGGVIDSRILNLLRVDKKRLGEALNELRALIPQTAVELPRLDQRIEWLVKRIDLTSRAGELLEAVDTGSSGLALPEADAIRDHCREVLQIVSKTVASAEEEQAAAKHLSLAEAVLDGADDRPSDSAAEALRKQLQSLQEIKDEDFHKPEWQPFEKLFKSLTSKEVPAVGELDRDEYVRQAQVVCAAALIMQFTKHVESSPSEEVRKKRMDRAPELVRALEAGPDESIVRARELVRQVEQNVTQADLVAEIQSCNRDGRPAENGNGSKPKRLMWIEIDPPTPLRYQLVTFRVRFARSALDRAAAQNEIQCKWYRRPAPASGLAESDSGKGVWESTELPGASTERRVSGSGRRAIGWMVGSYFIGEHEWQTLWRKAASGSGAKKIWRTFRSKLGFTTAEEIAPEDLNTAYIIKAEFPDLGKEIVSEPVRLERTKAYVESRTLLAVASLLITILIVAFGLLAGAQEKLQTLDWVSGVIAVLVLGFGADTLKNLIAKT